MSARENPMRPLLGTLTGVKDLADEIRLFQIELNGGRFDYEPGQFAFVSAFGVGEAPFGIASTSARTAALEFAVARVEFVDKDSGKVLGRSSCVGRTTERVNLGVGKKAEGLAKAIVKWIDARYPKPEPQK